ncbi:MAG: ABC transporter ATP-binding protein, partial [Armatimonadetes bacterium]|nr:ABC transporter ATP-binding protein [Armatimonadota bacterium]
MYAGSIVESALKGELFARPLHPYTQGLMWAVPKLTGGGIAEGIPGRIPDYLNPPPGCRFQPRCPHAWERCSQAPPLLEVEDGHQVACFLYEEGA